MALALLLPLPVNSSRAHTPRTPMALDGCRVLLGSRLWGIYLRRPERRLCMTLGQCASRVNGALAVKMKPIVDGFAERHGGRWLKRLSEDNTNKEGQEAGKAPKATISIPAPVSSPSVGASEIIQRVNSTGSMESTKCVLVPP